MDLEKIGFYIGFFIGFYIVLVFLLVFIFWQTAISSNELYAIIQSLGSIVQW